MHACTPTDLHAHRHTHTHKHTHTHTHNTKFDGWMNHRKSAVTSFFGTSIAVMLCIIYNNVK